MNHIMTENQVDEERTGSPPPSVVPPQQPFCLVDGTKLILRVNRHQPFQIDVGLKIIFSSGPLRKLDRQFGSTNYVADEAETTIVIDSGSLWHKFIPIVIGLHGGVLYTREGTAHVVVPGSGVIKRSRVSAASMPCKVANKFVAAQYLSSPGIRQMNHGGSATFFPWFAGASSASSNADSKAGIVFIRADDSIFQYRLTNRNKKDVQPRLAAPTDATPPTHREEKGGGESIELLQGRAVAWSSNVNFDTTRTMLCCRKVTGAGGVGTLWVDSGRLNPAAAAAAANHPLVH